MEGTVRLEYLLKDNKYIFIKNDVEVTELIPKVDIDLDDIHTVIKDRIRYGLIVETKKITGDLPIINVTDTNINVTQKKIVVTEKFSDVTWDFQVDYQVLATFTIDNYWEYQLLMQLCQKKLIGMGIIASFLIILRILVITVSDRMTIKSMKLSVSQSVENTHSNSDSHLPTIMICPLKFLKSMMTVRAP
jgi:hypothetical protein